MNVARVSEWTVNGGTRLLAEDQDGHVLVEVDPGLCDDTLRDVIGQMLDGEAEDWIGDAVIRADGGQTVETWAARRRLVFRPRHHAVRSPLSPHREQDGWVYTRQRGSILQPLGEPDTGEPRMFDAQLLLTGGGPLIELAYNDGVPGSRVISSRRVEEAVETMDYMARCVSAGLTVTRTASGWTVGESPDSHAWAAHGATLREAYWRMVNGGAQ